MSSQYMTELTEVMMTLAANGVKPTKRQEKAIKFLLTWITEWEAAKTLGILKVSYFGTEELDLGRVAELYAQDDGLKVPSAERIMREARKLLRIAQPAAWYWSTQEHNRKHAA